MGALGEEYYPLSLPLSIYIMFEMCSLPRRLAAQSCFSEWDLFFSCNAGFGGQFSLAGSR